MSTDQISEARPVSSSAMSSSRAAFLRRAGVGGAALAGVGVLLPGVALAGDPGDGVPDVDVLNYALSLEYLEATFYTQALGGPGTVGVPACRGQLHRHWWRYGWGGSFRGRGYAAQVYDLLTDIRDHEIAHVDFLRAGLGANAVGPCTYDFSSAFGSIQAFLATAQVFENTGVMAYDGAIRYVDAGDYLQAGAQIATIEARHAAFLNELNGGSPFPDAFDTGKKPSEIYAAIKPFLVTCPPAVVALFARLP